MNNLALYTTTPKAKHPIAGFLVAALLIPLFPHLPVIDIQPPLPFWAVGLLGAAVAGVAKELYDLGVKHEDFRWLDVAATVAGGALGCLAWGLTALL